MTISLAVIFIMENAEIANTQVTEEQRTSQKDTESAGKAANPDSQQVLRLAKKVKFVDRAKRGPIAEVIEYEVDDREEECNSGSCACSLF